MTPRRSVVPPKLSALSGAPSSASAARCCAGGVRISLSSNGRSAAKLSSASDALDEAAVRGQRAAST